MNVEIINVGTELLLGEIVNTNATYLQKMCKELGFNVYYQSVVGDNNERVKECLQIAFDRGANCVITTGGLGPTKDDLTKELSAQYLGLELVYDEKEASKVDAKCKFVSNSDHISSNNYKQAYFPKDCFILENEVGTANGCIMKKDEKMIINLPGPPKEMMYIVEHVLKPYLEAFRQEVLYTFDYLTMGIGESAVDEILSDIIDRQEAVTIAMYASEESVRIRLGCKASSQQEADVMMETTKQDIEEKLEGYIIQEKNLKEAVTKIMPSYFIEYLSDFRLRDSFSFRERENGIKGSMYITIDTKQHPLGEIVCIKYEYLDKEMCFEIPMLKKAELSYNKLESRMLASMYTFLKSIK